MNPYVKHLRPWDDCQLELVFENGERRIFDAKPYLRRGVFVCLENRAIVKAARVVAGSVEWPGELDLNYDTLYLESHPIASSFESSDYEDEREERVCCYPYAKRMKWNSSE